ncbi:metal-sulfur cluster assembly factor [Alicyclobacillus hesperidum]|uniref:metal-sulfur cluster assembly factor n=1 Tax=Alicyclobacillus hesperidum TaxID=89784 RepID=UPI0009FA3734|nr:iron-sulfur cluster assembly protein [Alicyclobacillus hesperidum]
MDDVRAKLQQVYDPEIGVNVVDLGLIYKMEEREEGSLYIEMTMTTPGCPAHDMISENVEWAAAQASGVAMVYVDVVWDPPWSPEMMSIDARRELGFI